MIFYIDFMFILTKSQSRKIRMRKYKLEFCDGNAGHSHLLKNKKVTVLSKWSFVTVYSKAAVYKCKCFSLTLLGYSHCINEK